MPLTPADVANKQFKIAFRGYSLDEVDAFLDEVEGELERLLRANAELTGRPAPAAQQTGPAALPTAPAAPAQASARVAQGEGQEAALRTLLLAQRTADEAIAEARAEAAELLAQARSEADELVAAAQARAASADSETATRVQTAMGGLAERKRELEQQIEDLRAFEREYRVRLKAYLEGQLRDLSSRGAPDDSGAGVPAAARAAAVGLAPAGPPREATEPAGRPDDPGPDDASPRTASLMESSTPAQELGPFTVAPPRLLAEELEEGPEAPPEH